jgi:diadenosine tetraphosphate (Ap4A) HIT family hydrolase
MRCVYCLTSGVLRDEQVLVRGEHLYVCAPLGQLVEGYLAIAPYRCAGCLAALPAELLAEVVRLKALVAEFYADAYGVSRPTFYEQGRGGAGARVDPADGFPLHAHLCGLPVDADAHALLAPRFARRPASGPSELAGAAGGHPYVYLECAGHACVYVPHTDAQRGEMERMRLKPELAALIGRPRRGHWRAYPGEAEVARVIRRFTDFSERRAA